MFPEVEAAAEVQVSAARVEPHRALYLRWRPRRFEDVVGQEHVTRTLRNAVKLGRPAHAYLFTGPRGTGKTTVARILYRAVNCEHADDGDPDNTCPLCKAALEGRALDLVEIDAASNRGIDDIRDLREKVAYRPGEGRYRLFIIDEAHRLTPEAWDAFLKTLEEPPPHSLFVLATTDAHRVPVTIVSRCQRFDFRRIPYSATKLQLQKVAEGEGLRVDPVVLERLALVARGGLRDALSLLDQLSAFAVGDIDMEVARAALSLPAIEAVRGVIDGMTRHDAATVMAVMSDAAEGGADLRLFADELIMHLRALLLLRAGADARLSDELPSDEVAWLRERAPAWSIGTLMELVQTLSDALARTRDAQQFQIQTEVALLAACDVESLVAAPIPSAPLPAATPPAARGVPIPTASAPTPQAHAVGHVSGPAVTASAPSASAVPRSPAEAPASAAPLTTVAASAPAAASPSVSASGPAAASPSVAVSAPGAAPSVSASGPAEASPSVAASAPDGGEAESASDSEATRVEAPAPPPPPREAESLAARWADVVDEVKRRNGLLASVLGSARPVALENALITVAFSTDFNRKTAEKSTNRQVIEAALQRIYGTELRLKAMVGNGEGGSLLDDPVINFAQRTFGGQPKRL